MSKAEKDSRSPERNGCSPLPDIIIIALMKLSDLLQKRRDAKKRSSQSNFLATEQNFSMKEYFALLGDMSAFCVYLKKNYYMNIIKEGNQDSLKDELKKNDAYAWVAEKLRIISAYIDFDDEIRTAQAEITRTFDLLNTEPLPRELKKRIQAQLHVYQSSIYHAQSELSETPEADLTYKVRTIRELMTAYKLDPAEILIEKIKSVLKDIKHEEIVNVISQAQRKSSERAQNFMVAAVDEELPFSNN